LDLIKQYKKEIEDLEGKKKSKQEDLVSDYRNRLEDANSIIEKQNNKISNLQKELNKKEKLLNTPKKEIKPKSPGSTTTDDDIAVLETTLLFVVPEKPRFNENIEKGLDERVYDLLETLDKYKYFNEDHTIFTRIVKLLKRNLDECKTTLYCTFWLRQVMYLVDKSSEIILKESIKDISTLLPNIVETTAEDEIYDLDYVSPNLYLEYLKKLVVSFYFKLIELVVHDTKKPIFNCFFEKSKRPQEEKKETN